MRNGAYSLAFLATVFGLVLLAMAGPGDGLSTSLGAVLVVVAILLAGLGKGLDLLGYVHEGATEGDE